MALISDLNPYILPEVPGASVPLVESMAKSVLRDFCIRSRIWKGSVTAFNTVNGTQSYSMTPPAESEIVRIESVRYAGVELDPTTEDELDLLYTAWTTQTGTPTHYFTRDGVTLSLFPIPSAAGQITARVSLRPSAATAQLPDFIFANYREAIAAGVRAGLMMMSNKEWSNPNIGQLNISAYTASVERAEVAAVRAQTKAPIRTRPQYF